MGASTKIEWTGATWSPIRASNKFDLRVGWHCEIVTPGCEACYAQAINKRLGTGRQFLRREREHVDVFLDEEMLTAPLRWRKPKMIFVESMSDLFGEWVPHDMLRRVFRAMDEAPQHTYQILTKRAERLRDFMQWWVMDRVDQPPPNWWLGVSCEDQRRADERIPVLLDTPAAVRWVSAEPLLGPVKFRETLGEHWLASGKSGERKGLDWTVIGGESGPQSRPLNIEWARSIIKQCKAAKVPVFMKQLGAKPYAVGSWKQEIPLKMRHRKGGDISEFPEDLRVREYPFQAHQSLNMQLPAYHEQKAFSD